ncbi:MAG TPA: hypothetical protein VMB79_05625 [Jatrophihabitans sp.]|nr:hypothetical protein [Jatrophihabitans sp.]
MTRFDPGPPLTARRYVGYLAVLLIAVTVAVVAVAIVLGRPSHHPCSCGMVLGPTVSQPAPAPRTS